MTDKNVDRSVIMDPREHSNPGLREPPHIDDQSRSYFDRTLKDVMEDAAEDGRSNGLAIVVGIVACTSGGPAGVKEDLKTMESVFKKLGLAVWRMKDKSNADIAGVLQAVGRRTFPKTYKFIIVYFSGHGESQDNHAYVHCYEDEDKNTPADTLSIEKGIVAPLLTKNAPKLKGLHRIFLFDCCLKDDPAKGEACRLEDISLPSFDSILIAYATSMTFIATGDNQGGLWTKFLARNITELDVPLTTILDLTWEDAVMDFNNEHSYAVLQGEKIPQGPHYTSSTGLIWLWHPGLKWEQGEKLLPRWFRDEKKEKSSQRKSSPPASNVTYNMGGINIGPGANIGAFVGAGAHVGNVIVPMLAKSRAKPAAANVDPELLDEYVWKLQELKDWRRLALRLRFSFEEIRKMMSDNDGCRELCIMEMMSKWLGRGPTSTTAALIKALDGVQEHAIAASLQEGSSSKPGVPLTSLPDGPLNSSDHFAVISRELRELVEWQRLGMELGLEYSTLQSIGLSRQNNVELCKMDMLQAWLQGKDNTHGHGGITKKALVDALERADFQALALKLDPAREKSGI